MNLYQPGAVIAALFCAGCGTSDPPAGDQSAACRNSADNQYVVELNGTAFSGDDSTRIHATTNIELAEPAASGTLCQTIESTDVVYGAFELELTNLTDTAVYPFIGAFLDRDDDGACTALDPTWGIYGSLGPPGEPSVINLDPSLFMLDDPRDVCMHFAAR